MVFIKQTNKTATFATCEIFMHKWTFLKFFSGLSGRSKRKNGDSGDSVDNDHCGGFSHRSHDEYDPDEGLGSDSKHPLKKSSASLAPGDIHAMANCLLGLVDLIDEVHRLKVKFPFAKGCHDPLDVIESRISDIIELSGGEIINDTIWNPSRQRPVETQLSNVSTLTFASSRSSGLQIGGRLIRKQDVVLLKPQNAA